MHAAPRVKSGYRNRGCQFIQPVQRHGACERRSECSSASMRPFELEARTLYGEYTRLACAMGKVKGRGRCEFTRARAPRHGWASAGAASPGTGRITLGTTEPRLVKITSMAKLVLRSACLCTSGDLDHIARHSNLHRKLQLCHLYHRRVCLFSRPTAAAQYR